MTQHLTFPDSPRLNAPWRDQLFNTRAAKQGGILRRNKHSINREIGVALLVAEVRARGFRLYEVGDDYVIVCHRRPIRQLC
ncbi:hypothetical protein [Marivita geojedonensis]|uniref:hypothetical protein n=1 Tax=Marivita geojedonensis TaxID=1123756 RepID=UPI000A1E205A|nr:hypothetical protein [Marivita geojedonensis]